MRKTAIFFLSLFINVVILAAPPATYYNAANGQQGENLRSALSTIIGNHTVVSYDNLNYLYVATDSHSDGSIWDMYSTCAWQHNQNKCGNYKVVCDCYNKEHSVPQSWFSSRSPMVSDAFHVYPTDGKVNGQRSNYPFGECASGTILSVQALGKLGSSTFSGYSGTVFEPVDDYKGDFARTYFYMATRYMSACSSWSGGMFGSVSGLTSYSVALLMKWHRQDPVSEKERVRNDAIFGLNNTTGYAQGNRNPFIDYPCLAEYIWGNQKGVAVDFSTILSTYSADYLYTSDLSGCTCTPVVPAITSPNASSTIDIGAANVNGTATKQVLVKGVLLTQSIGLSIGGVNANLFSVSPSTISAADALLGKLVTLTYSPVSLGNHSANIIIASSELATATTVSLTGNCSSALVLPTTDEIYFLATSATQSILEPIVIKGTNLSSSVNLSVSGTNANKFSLSRTVLTAAEVTSGVSIDVFYTPNVVGTHQATLTVSSADFKSVQVPLVASCIFQILEATQITHNGFTGNWTNAGVTDYTLNVYSKTSAGIPESDILTDECNQATSGVGVNTYTDVSGCIRLGSGSKLGTLTYSNINLSNGGSVVVNAQYYNNDAGTQMKVSVGSVSQIFDLTSSLNDYVLTVPANTNNGAASVIIESLVTGKRVNVNKVVVKVGSENSVINPVSGYPRSVGNVQSYVVGGLNADSTYFYTVTPNGLSVSEEMEVHTDKNSSVGINYTVTQEVVYYVNNDLLHVLNIMPESLVLVYDCTARLCQSRTHCKTEEVFNLPQGVYILKIRNNNSEQSFKIMK